MRIWVLLGTALFLGVYSIPYIARDQAVIWLHQQGVEDVTLKTVKIDWWRGEVALEGLSAHSTEKPSLSLSEFKVRIDYAALMEKRIWLSAISLDQLQGSLEEDSTGLWLGPINLLNVQSGSQPETESSESEWMIGLSDLKLQAVNWRFRLPQFDQTLNLEQASLNHLTQWQPTENSSFILKGRLNDSAFHITSDSTLLPAAKQASIHLALDEIVVESFAKFWVPQLKAQLSTELDIKLNLDGTSVVISHSGDILVKQLSWQEDQLAVSAPSLKWSGEGDVSLQTLALEKVSIKGKLNSDQLSLKQLDQSVGMSRFDWQGGLNLYFKQQLNKIQGSQAFTVKQLSVQSGSTEVGLAELKQKGPIQFSLHKETADGIQAELDALLTGLTLVTPDSQLNVAAVSVQSPLNIQLRDKMQVSAQPTLGLQNLLVKQSNGVSAELSQAQLSATLTNSLITQPDLSGINLSAENLRMVQQEKGLALLNVAAIKLEQGRYSHALTGLASGFLKGVEINQVADKPAMLAVDTLNLKALEYLPENKTLKVKTLAINNSLSNVTVTDKLLIAEIERLKAAFIPTDGITEKAHLDNPTESIQDQEEGLHVVIGNIAMRGNNTIYFADYSVKPVFKSQLNITKLDVASIDSKLHKQSPFELEAMINKHAVMSASGKLSLTNGMRDGEWRLALNNAELPVVSPYAGRYVGYYLQSGQLDFESTGQVKKGVLSGDNHIVLNRLEVKAAQTDATDAFNQKLSMPLGTAISVLQDDKQNITLDMPMDGSLDDPKFGYQDIINRLATKGLKKAAFSFLTKALQPYGALISIASAAISANESGAFIQLSPVAFEPGLSQTGLRKTEMGDYLAKIAEMMKERQGLRLNVCGNAVQTDKAVIWPTIVKENSASKTPLKLEALEALLAEKLQQLAVSRGEFVTNWLLKRGLEKDRLFTCFPIPNVANPELKPSVVLSL